MSSFRFPHNQELAGPLGRVRTHNCQVSSSYQSHAFWTFRHQPSSVSNKVWTSTVMGHPVHPTYFDNKLLHIKCRQPDPRYSVHCLPPDWLLIPTNFVPTWRLSTATQNYSVTQKRSAPAGTTMSLNLRNPRSSRSPGHLSYLRTGALMRLRKKC